MRRRRRVSGRPSAATVAALRELVAPPEESEADAERFVADIMARIHAEADVAVAVGAGASEPPRRG